ncbi:MAG: conserved membrane protein of unknown function [Promethearchaeota archaeon]|nr:MAG: conserved membrane protein of unknown function [Candidatus Lokiarchaeota archaeon]
MKTNKLKEHFLKILESVMFMFQYMPTLGIWKGLMSIPFIVYMLYIFQYPNMLMGLISLYGILFIFGLVFFLYSLIYKRRQRNNLITTGPYKLVRHPQYLGIIISTFAITLESLDYNPISIFLPPFFTSHGFIFLFWIFMVFIYIILARIEENSLLNSFGSVFIEYKNQVPFMVPLFGVEYISKISDNKILNHIETSILKIINVLLFLFQYIPVSLLYFGLMSLPFIVYIFYIFQFPWIWQDLLNPIFIFGLSLFFYSLIYKLKYREKLITTGPYKYVRHPQYLGIIIATLGLTWVNMFASPITIWVPQWFATHSTIFLFWTLMVVIYIFLASIEEVILTKSYGKEFLEYKNSVPAFIPFLGFKKYLEKRKIIQIKFS